MHTADESGAPNRSRSPRAAAGETLTDEQVVDHVLSGEQQAFELLMRRYNQRLYRIVRGIVRSAAEAEDVLQETYLAAYRHLAQFEGRARFSTWLTRIAINQASARVRRRQPRSWSDLGANEVAALVELNSARSAPDDPLSNGELAAALQRALRQLPRRLRLTFLLRDVEGLSTVEVAECLGISSASARVRLHRARLALAILIDEQLGAETRQLFQFGGRRCDRLVRSVMAALASSKRQATPARNRSGLSPPAAN